MREIPRVLIAGTGSGCGKTTVVCAVLSALKAQGDSVCALKSGPDYIDPMFHRAILGIPSRNLDLFLCGDKIIPYLLERAVPCGATAVVEGAMGFYDGLAGSGEASAAQLSSVLQMPVVLVVNVRGKGLSLGAEVQGYLNFSPNRIGAVILNGATAQSYCMYKEILQTHCDIEVLGYLPHLPDAGVEHRHLGLITAEEVEGLQEKMKLLGEAAHETIDLERLLQLACEAPPLCVQKPDLPLRHSKVRIGVARDRAFCFLYEENLELLEEMGVRIVFFSPLDNQRLPEGIQGLVLPGGYPELYAQELAANRSMLRDIRMQVEQGLPTIAECGGFMVLCQSIYTLKGKEYPMAGVLPGVARMTAKLGRFGYFQLQAQGDNLLCRRNDCLRVHEFHYSQADDEGGGMVAEKPGREGRWPCVHATETLWAGYPHLHFWGNFPAVLRYLQACEKYGNRGKKR